ncbi:centrosomal protein CCDC61 [Aethina tumida]|uniref:centrosomal protein CCDC61 n=1 Tax=Aethina tumida TaxID=116153 RepID=UPI00096B3668|nr:centrosomal protein CCDC61 [Aethina tumida]
MGFPNFVSTCTFHGQEYIFKMNVLNNNLEILLTDKCSGEEWQCNYDDTQIENITRKTGNFKQFEIFVAMIKSGLLKTCESVTLDLLTYEEFESLRHRKITKYLGPDSYFNRRYLILTYAVEFDKIRYPIPLEYCGPPDPIVLQKTIKRLEMELAKTKYSLSNRTTQSSSSRRIYRLQRRIEELTAENAELTQEIEHLKKVMNKNPKTSVANLQKAVTNLEESVVSERKSHHQLVEKLKQDKMSLSKELERVKQSEKYLKAKLAKKELTPTKYSPSIKNRRFSNLNKVESKSSSYNNNNSDLRFTRTKSYSHRQSPIRSVIRTCTSRSSSTSTKCPDPVESDRFRSPCTSSISNKVFRPRGTIRQATSQRKCVRNISKGSVSSASSKKSSKPRSKSKKKISDYENLELKILDLEKLLKRSLKR